MVSGEGSGRVSMAAMVCLKPGHRGHVFFRLRIHGGAPEKRPGNLACHGVDQLAAIVRQRLKRVQ